MTVHSHITTEPFTLQRRNPAGGTKPLTKWGFANETDVLTDVLLGSPAFLRHLATSSLSRKHLREAPCNIQIAQAQHKDLVAAYENFGVKIHWHEPTPELPMQVYSRDSSVMTPYGAIITAMANWWRRGENYAAIRTYEKLGIPIYDMVTAGTFEGGDFNVIEDGCVLIGCGGARTQEEGARQVAGMVREGRLGNPHCLIDEYYVHIDLMVVPIAEKLTAVCLACTEPGIVDWLKGKGHEIIDVPFQDTMALGCNFMSLGKDRVIAPTVSKTLIGQLKARGFEVADVDMSEISKTGGGIHCMAQALKRVPAWSNGGENDGLPTNKIALVYAKNNAFRAFCRGSSMNITMARESADFKQARDLIALMAAWDITESRVLGIGDKDVLEAYYSETPDMMEQAFTKRAPGFSFAGWKTWRRDALHFRRSIGKRSNCTRCSSGGFSGKGIGKALMTAVSRR